MTLELVVYLPNFVFMNNKREMYKLRGFINFFFIFKISQISSKITIFIIEISLKQHLHTKYGRNNPNSRRLGLKSPKFYFLPFLVARNSSHTQTFEYMSWAQFSS